MIALGYYGENSFDLLNKDNDKAAQDLIIEAKVENKNFWLINLYYVNTEPEKLSTLFYLSNVFEKINANSNKSVLLGGSFNLFLEAKLETQGSNPVLKREKN